MAGLARRFHPRRIRRTLGAAACVRERARFVWRELRDVPGVGRYRLRGTPLVALIRHPLLDMWVLEEVFRSGVYEPPAEVARGLRSLDRPIRVVDLGGHVGLFALFLRTRFPDAQIVSVEPDPGNSAQLREAIAANRLADRWQLIEASAGVAQGRVRFRSSFHLSQVASGPDDALERFQRRIGGVFPFLREGPLLAVREHEVTSIDVFGLLDDADLVKIDIEGSEWPILGDARFSGCSAPALVLEYHPAYLERDAEQAVLEAVFGAGYRVCTHARNVDAGIVWAWKEPGRTS